MEKRGLLVVISGPAGTGKGTVVKELVQNGCAELSVSATTRAPREGEENGIHYHFLSKEQFESMIHEDGFLEYAEYCNNYYGSPKKPIQTWLGEGKNVILEIEVEGCQKIKEQNPDCISIFIMPPSMEELEKRLRNRGTETEDVIQKRLKRAEEEIEISQKYDYIIVNDTVDKCVSDIRNVLDTEQAKL